MPASTFISTVSSLFTSTVISSSITLTTFIICTAASLLLGALVALTYMYKNHYTPSFVLSVAILPAVVQLVIMLVNGNLGAGVAVTGAFSLARFRSAEGTAHEISVIFITMAIGLATGMGYLGIATVFTVIILVVMLIYTRIGLGSSGNLTKTLKITIPENLDYTTIFDDVFKKYTKRAVLNQVKTVNFGTMYRLDYEIILKNSANEKLMIDELRCRNGNLDIICGRLLPKDTEAL